MPLETVQTNPKKMPAIPSAISPMRQPSTLGNLKFPNFKDVVDSNNQAINTGKGQAQVTIQNAIKEEEDGAEEFIPPKIPSLQNMKVKKSKTALTRWLGRNDINA